MPFLNLEHRYFPWSTSFLFFSLLPNHLQSSFPIRNVPRRDVQLNSRAMCPGNTTNGLPFAQTVNTPHSSACWFMLLVCKYSFQLRELLLIHKILVYLIWEVSVLSVLGWPLGCMLSQKHASFLQTMCLSLKWESQQCGHVTTACTPYRTAKQTIPVCALSTTSVSPAPST